MMKIGHGYDVHGFIDGDFLVIGGVKIPYKKSFAAYSDGDVLLHALCDCLLGALALGDIGNHFPDTSVDFKNIDSRILLRRVFKIIQKRNYCVSNIDATIIAQAPKMQPYIKAMRTNIAVDLDIEIEQINIKATTTEKLGFIGQQEGIAAHSVCLLIKQ